MRGDKLKLSRLELLPILLDTYKDKINIDVEKGEIQGLAVNYNHKGYKYINFWHEGKSKQYKVHEIISYLGGLDLLDLTVNHINGIKTDNRLENLETLSAIENHRKHKFEYKLSIDTMRKINRRFTGTRGEKTKMAREYGVDVTTICNILKKFESGKLI